VTVMSLMGYTSKSFINFFWPNAQRRTLNAFDSVFALDK
jgi:hypothetical protein